MENASKALLMASGILIGILILALIVTLFLSSRELFGKYEETKKSEAVQQFNVNFTQYLGEKKLTIHEVVTICNFAEENGVTIESKPKSNIGNIVSNYSNEEDSIKKYTLTIKEYSEDGYVKVIRID